MEDARTETIKDEIQAAKVLLNMSDEDIRVLPDSEAEVLFSKIVGHFVGKDRKWWWEAFKFPSASVRIAGGKGFQRIVEIVPNPVEKIWVVAEEDQLPFYPVYEATPTAIQSIIGECYGFEYYLIPKEMDWLLCENHHDTLIGIGAKVMSKLQKIENGK